MAFITNFLDLSRVSNKHEFFNPNFEWFCKFIAYGDTLPEARWVLWNQEGFFIIKITWPKAN